MTYWTSKLSREKCASEKVTGKRIGRNTWPDPKAKS